MQRIVLTKTNLKEAITSATKVLTEGGIVIFPTETCYGVGVDATNQEAVDQVLKYKSRREGKPLSVAVNGKEMASKYVEINDIADNLYENYLPGPITVVSKSLGKVAKGIESEYGTLGIRVPAYQLILDTVETFGKPITSTSANVSYKKVPYNIDELLEDLPQKQKDMIDLILDAGTLPKNDPSTVIDTTLNNMNVMREGSMKFDSDISDDKAILHAKTTTAEETIDFGSLTVLKHIDVVIERPLVLALKGELGAGKTQFAKGIARSLHVDEDVSSPTYTIIDEYKYELGTHRKGYFVHMDTWRVDGSDEFLRTGLEGYLTKGNIIAIEWADKFYSDLVDMVVSAGGEMLKVDFKYISETEREIIVYVEK